MWRRGKLSNRILASVILILVASTVVGFGLDAIHGRSQLQHQAQERALSVAQTFAAMPSIREGLYRHDRRDRRLIQSLAQQVRRETGASYIVVVNRAGIRYSHPDPALIGQRVSEPVVALDGRDHLDVDHGNLGVSANAKVPLRAPGGRIIGEVSAGIPEARVWSQLVAGLPRLGLYFLSALAIGVVASLLLTRRLKRVTFGLELEEIAALVQEREAMLHNIREGVITVDREGRVSLINDEARRLLSVGGSALHARLQDIVAPGRLHDLLTGAVGGRDQIVLTDAHVLVVNRVPALHHRRTVGAVITLRDRTELEALVRELDGVAALTDALRAQQHEFANRMHTIAGLIEIGDPIAAARYALDVTHGGDASAEAIRAKVESPEIAALLLAKITIAAERGVRLRVTDDSRLPADGVEPTTILTIVGNLIDNAIDAATTGEGPPEVTIGLTADDVVTIMVVDTGAGMSEALSRQIFTDGFTTKPATHARPRGLGLALVQRLVRASHGTIVVDRTSHTTFIVTLPRQVRRAAEVSA